MIGDVPEDPTPADQRRLYLAMGLLFMVWIGLWLFTPLLRIP